MIWLIVCQDEDREAGWLAERLRASAFERVEIARSSELTNGARWEHRVGSYGARTIVTLADGRVLDSAEVAAVFNRLIWVMPYVAGASAEDREYAGNELQALALSWLRGFAHRVVNRPSPIGLCGPWRSAGEWQSIARREGVPVAQPEAGGDEPPRCALVVDGVEVGCASGAEPAMIQRLAEAARLDVFGVGFAIGSDGEWRFTNLELLPSIQAAREPGADAVARLLRARAGVAP